MIEARFKVRRNGFLLDAELTVPDRGVTALFGPSGSGKTTILRAVAGLDRHPESYLKVVDEVWQDGPLFIPTHRRPIGYVFQEPSLFSHLSVRRNLEYGLRRVPEAYRKLSLEKSIDMLGIGDLLDRGPDSLSGGEKQRVSIARALSVSPRLLLMDEPLSSLDEPRKQEIMPYLESLHRSLEIPVIYVSHSPDEVARLADHLVLLSGGRVEAGGPVTEMLTRLDLPLAVGEDAEAIIEAKVAVHDDEFDLTHLDFPGGRFTVPGSDLAVGSFVRLRVAARDVSITLDRQKDTSILNIFPAVVEETVTAGGSQMTIRLDCGGVPLLARVTRKSASVLGLAPGKRVFAQAKSVAVLS